MKILPFRQLSESRTVIIGITTLDCQTAAPGQRLSGEPAIGLSSPRQEGLVPGRPVTKLALRDNRPVIE